MIALFVPGTPKSKGSLVTGVRKDGSRFNRTQQAHGQAEWAATVKHEVAAFMAARGVAICDYAIALELTFTRSRPQSHFTARGALRPQYEGALPKSAPDWDKVGRSVSDALQGVLYLNDAQVTTCVVRKRWGAPGVYIVARADVDAPDAWERQVVYFAAPGTQGDDVA